jgi:hypothetical protein
MGVHVLSVTHLVRQVWATQILVSSVQSASATHWTQRPAATSQTCEVGHSSEFWQVVIATHFRAVHSLLAGQSFTLRQSTHCEVDVSQTLPDEHSRLF